MRISGLFLVLLIFCIGCVYSQSVATGTNYTFLSKVNDPKFTTFDWRLQNNLVVEWDPTYGNKSRWFGTYERRANLNVKTGDLTMKLEKEDSGEFVGQFQVEGGNNALQYSKYNIKVIDPVSKSVVTCTRNVKNITLTCSVDPPVQAKFSWTGPNGFSDRNSVIIVSPQEGSDENIYFCTAENDVSRNVAEFNIKNCKVDNDEPSKNGNGGTIAGIIVGILILLAVVAAGIFFYFRKQAAAPASTPGELTALAEKTSPSEAKPDTQSGAMPDVEATNNGTCANLSKQGEDNQEG